MKSIDDIKEIQRISLNLLHYFDQYCKDNNLTYFLAWGTLLGAVRHHGFIPWDDDIDLMMPREDYNRLMEIAPDIPHTGIRFLKTKKQGNFVNANFRIADDTTIVDLSGVRNPSKQGIWVTVFPIDNLPDDPNLKEKYLRRISYKYKLLLLSTLKNSILKPKNIKSFVAKVLNLFCSVSVSKVFYRSLDRDLRRYENNATSTVGLLSIGTGNKTSFPRECIFSAKYLVFEDREYPVPIGYDQILKNTYGDYMELPPVEQRVPKHDFVAYYK